MGLQIGQIPALLASAGRGAPAFGAPRVNPDLVRGQGVGQQADPSETPFFQGANSRPVIGPGFGEGTVSGPAAALDALTRGVEIAARAVPSLDDIRDQFAARRLRQQAVTQEQTAAIHTRLSDLRATVEFRIPEANPGAMNQFTQALQFSEPELAAPQSTRPEAAPSETAGPVEFASARPPEAPDFATARQPDAPEPAEAAAPVTEFFTQSAQGRFDLTA